MADQTADVRTLAEARNAQDGGDRGFGWRMKMWFKSEGALARRIAAHNVENGTAVETNKGKKNAKYKSTGADPNITSPKLQDTLIEEMKGMSLAELQKAAKDPARSQFERIVFGQAAAEKIKEQVWVKGKVKGK